MKKGKKKLVLLITMILSIINIGAVKADTKNIEVDSISVKEKSGTITVVDPVLSSNEVTSNITFNKKDDFVTFELKIKNNENDKYKIESIEDNNTNTNIKIEYNHNEDYISKGETTTVTIKLTYKNKLLNVEKINLNNLVVTINLVNEQGETTNVVVNNPITGDNILMYLLFLILALTGLIFISKKVRIKGVKIGAIVFLLSMLTLPFAIFALEKFEVKVKFTDVVIKGEFETYNISIDKGDGSAVEVRQITYGETLGDLGTNPSKEGYDFEKWIDNNGNEVTEDTVITGPIEVEAKYKAKEYTISYDLGGGTASNPSKYTIEDEITLNNPTKSGYTFSGWTGTGIDTKTTSVTIQTGSIGNRSYKANYSANQDTAYTVTHRYQNLNGTYTEEVVTEHGATDTEVNAPKQLRTGFTEPAAQTVTIAGDGSSSVTYTYEREEYAFSITDRTYIDSSSTTDGTYPYETPISIKVIERDGYTFKWSDNNTNYERTFDLTGETSLTPIYTANTDTPYKVEHYKMNFAEGDYTLADTQNLTGTTDSEITPAVNTYEGFTSPETQTTTINGNGNTVVKYYYTRNKQTITINNPENIVEGDLSGDYYYGQEITLTAKDIDGKTFSKWSNDETNNPITITIGTSDIVIGPIYNGDQVTVTFNTDGGSEIASQTIDYGTKITRPTTDPTKTNYIFIDWYTNKNYDTLFDFENALITSDTVIYAKFEEDSFPEVFSEPGECTFNGSNGVLAGDNCSYANGTNKYIDTGINLYNNENHDKDYEIGFTIVSYNPSEQVKQATFMNIKLEGNNYPGLVFRRKDLEAGYDLSSRNTSSANARLLFNSGTIQKFKVYRITNTDTGVQEIFYSINDEEKIKINDLSQFNPEFDLSVWFGAAPTNASATAAQRILVNTTLKDMYIKLGTYQESSSTDKYKVTYNANGGSVSPSSKTINIGEQIGTLPTPTAPTGKSFIGWYTGLTDGVEVTNTYTPNSNVTIYARYYTDVTGATVSPSSISILNGSSKTLTISNVDEEYTFSSNDTNVATVDQTGKVTGTGVGTTTIIITGSTSGKTKTVNVTVEAAAYTITLDPNGGSVNQTSITIDIDTPIGELPIPTAPSNKEFYGWYDDLTSGNQITSSYIPTDNETIYARYVKSCNGFATDSWENIKNNVENDPNYYSVGCQKSLLFDVNGDGKNESYDLVVVNTSDCTTNVSESGCGFVLQFKKSLGTSQNDSKMNSTKTNAGGWPNSLMYSYLNETVYNTLPDDLKNVIKKTKTISGYGLNGTTNYVSYDKLFLLSPKEVGLEYHNDDTAYYNNRTLDYYTAGETSSANSKRVKYGYNSGAITSWWLRSAYHSNTFNFNIVTQSGDSLTKAANNTNMSIIPAFRIGNNTYIVTFDTNEGSSVDSQTVNYGEKATRPSTDPTKTGYTFDNWYTDDTYTTIFDFDNTVITSDTAIYAHFEELKVCADNENITRLSENTCSNNENITVGDGIVCKRAIKLHEETCSQTSTSIYCSGAGYTESGGKGTSTITYGNCGTSGTLTSGDAFTCDVNGDEKFDELTERFYYVSDYYDTSAKEFDTSTAVLIYYNNVTSGVSCNKNTFAYSTQADIQTVDPSRTSYDNWHGPLTVMKQLPTTSQWSNVSLKSDTRAILGEYQSTHNSPTTSGGTLPTDFSYEGYAARLLTAKELMAGCNLTEVGRNTIGELDSCNYVMENTKYAKSSIESYGGWLETPRASYSISVWNVYGYSRSVNGYGANNAGNIGARPAIEVLKSKISY